MSITPAVFFASYNKLAGLPFGVGSLDTADGRKSLSVRRTMASGFICLVILPDIGNPPVSDRLHTHVFWELKLMSLKSSDVDGCVLRFVVFLSFFLISFFLPSYSSFTDQAFLVFSGSQLTY